MNGGFSGFVSSLRYFSSSIGVNDIQNILSVGPNLTTIGDSMVNSQPNYLSMRWFFENNTSN